MIMVTLRWSFLNKYMHMIYDIRIFIIYRHMNAYGQETERLKVFGKRTGVSHLRYETLKKKKKT